MADLDADARGWAWVLPAMRRRAACLIMIGGLLAASCTFLAVGDGALRVRGRVVAGDRSAQNCTLKLRLQRTGEAIAVSSVEGSFELTFGVNPAPRRYSVHIWCQGLANTYDSHVFRSRGLETFHHPIDLGTIQLSPSPEDVR